MRYHYGPPVQYGSGLGSIFSGLIRSLMPIAKNTVKTIGKIAKSNTARSAGRIIGKEAKKVAIGTALDALEGKKVGAAAKRRLKTATKKILQEAKSTPVKKSNNSRVKRRNVNFGLTNSKKMRGTRKRALFDEYSDIDDDEY